MCPLATPGRADAPQEVFDGQWVFDCVEAGELLPLDKYRVKLRPADKPPPANDTPGRRKRCVHCAAQRRALR